MRIRVITANLVRWWDSLERLAHCGILSLFRRPMVFRILSLFGETLGIHVHWGRVRVGLGGRVARRGWSRRCGRGGLWRCRGGGAGRSGSRRRTCAALGSRVVRRGALLRGLLVSHLVFIFFFLLLHLLSARWGTAVVSGGLPYAHELQAPEVHVEAAALRLPVRRQHLVVLISIHSSHAYT